MCFFKKKKKNNAKLQEKKKEDNVTFQDWNNSTCNFGFNERSSKLEGDFQYASTNSSKNSDKENNNDNLTKLSKK